MRVLEQKEGAGGNGRRGEENRLFNLILHPSLRAAHCDVLWVGDSVKEGGGDDDSAAAVSAGDARVERKGERPRNGVDEDGGPRKVWQHHVSEKTEDMSMFRMIGCTKGRSERARKAEI